MIFALIFGFSKGQDFVKLAVGDFQLIAINDLTGVGTFNEIFVDGPLGPPVDPSTYQSELIRLGYTINTLKTGFYCPIMTLYGIYNGTQFIIDTGLGLKISANSQLKQQLENLGINRNSIDYVILTHGHPDHSGMKISPILQKITRYQADLLMLMEPLYFLTPS